MTIEDIKHQLEVNHIGSMNVTRALLPVFRKQRKGLIITISSGAGIQGFEFSSAYAASKFATEGWMDALQKEVEHFGINTMLVNPGFFRTELISNKSMSYADGSITDYDKLRDKQKKWWESMAGKQSGDPKKLSEAIYQLTQETNIPTRFVAGRDVIEIIDRKIEDFRSQVNSYRDLSSSLDFG